ncbi:TPA: hypothetical protein JI227_11160 [Acinetobacter baumannii]|nr:hypothetical protein [Acinetobacter baumannii]
MSVFDKNCHRVEGTKIKQIGLWEICILMLHKKMNNFIINIVQLGLCVLKSGRYFLFFGKIILFIQFYIRVL